ncbi:MAG: TetR/AcrR family transcriptional regulator [bacterium]
MSDHIAEPRWRRLPEERPKQILDAALAVFAERGLATARLDDIAKLAGVSKGTIYLYFANKEDLFRGVVRSTVIAFIEQSEAEFEAERDPRRALESWMERHWAWIRSATYPAIHRLVASELRDFPDLHAFYATEVVGRAQRLICDILERGMEDGVFRRMAPLEAARMLSALFATHGTWYHQRNSFKSIANIGDDVLLAQIRDFFFHAMRPDDERTIPHAE